MDFNFTEEQTMIRDSLARLIKDQYDFDTRRKVAKSEPGWRPEMWSQFAELGLLGASFTEAEGGFGSGPIEAMIISEEFGKGLSVANLKNFRQFYLTFPDAGKSYALRSELSWTHWRLVMRVGQAREAHQEESQGVRL